MIPDIVTDLEAVASEAVSQITVAYTGWEVMGWKFCSYCGDEMVESRATVPDVSYNVITGAKIETFEVSWCCQRAVRTLAGALDHRSLDPHHDYHVMEMTDCRICGKKHWSREPCPDAPICRICGKKHWSREPCPDAPICRICGKKHWSREPCPVEKESRKISPEIPPTTEPLHSASARNGSTSDEGVDKVGSTECPECGHQFTPPVSEQRKAYMREYMRERRK